VEYGDTSPTGTDGLDLVALLELAEPSSPGEGRDLLAEFIGSDASVAQDTQEPTSSITLGQGVVAGDGLLTDADLELGDPRTSQEGMSVGVLGGLEGIVTVLPRPRPITRRIRTRLGVAGMRAARTAGMMSGARPQSQETDIP
jgi:hypothetical protein